jgi:ATPase subunit of ABC transporter with duplicated ATPase domains
LLDRYNEIAANYTDETAEEMSSLQDKIDAQNLWDLESQIEMAMDALRCPDGSADVNNLSGGEKRRVALCKLLLEAPDLLLLDEPTNHLDAESVAWLERHLREYTGTVVLVTHDRYFLDNVTGWILELDRGHGIPHEGNYSTWLDVQQKRLAQESEQEEARVRSLARESAWVKSSPRARQAKSKARIQAYEELLSKSQDARQGTTQIIVPAGPRLGSVVVEATDLAKAYGDQLLFDDMNFRLPPGGIVGVIGPNGAGKTTMFRILTGQEKPDSGSLRIGESVVMGYVDQSRDSLKPNATVWEEISGGLDMLELGKRTVPSRAYVSAFNFKGGDQQKSRSAIGRRAQPRSFGEDIEVGRQSAAAGRADQ